MFRSLHAPLRYLWAGCFAIASAAIAVHAFAYLQQDFQPRNPFHSSFAQAGLWVPMHFFGAGLALLLAPLQLAAGLRARWPRLHRIGGWLYVVAVGVGAVAGHFLAPRAQGGWATGASFLLLAVLWLAATGLAVAHAIGGRHAQHRRWMLRSVAMTFAAVTLRLYLGLGIGILGLSFLTAYTAAAWLCWTVNLALLELHLRRPWQRWRRRAAGTRSAFRPADA